jgi:hypothetical protein
VREGRSSRGRRESRNWEGGENEDIAREARMNEAIERERDRGLKLMKTHKARGALGSA